MRKRIKSRTYINEKEGIAFGEKVKAIRLEKKLTQRDVAFEAEIDERTVRRIEKSEIVITLDLLFSLSKALKITPSELLKE